MTLNYSTITSIFWHQIDFFYVWEVKSGFFCRYQSKIAFVCNVTNFENTNSWYNYSISIWKVDFVRKRNIFFHLKKFRSNWTKLEEKKWNCCCAGKKLRIIVFGYTRFLKDEFCLPPLFTYFFNKHLFARQKLQWEWVKYSFISHHHSILSCFLDISFKDDVTVILLLDVSVMLISLSIVHNM